MGYYFSSSLIGWAFIRGWALNREWGFIFPSPYKVGFYWRVGFLIQDELLLEEIRYVKYLFFKYYVLLTYVLLTRDRLYNILEIGRVYLIRVRNCLFRFYYIPKILCK